MNETMTGPMGSTRQQMDALKLERERAKLIADQAKAQQAVNKANPVPPVNKQAPPTSQPFDDSLLGHMIMKESSGFHRSPKTGQLTESPEGAKGILQFLPETAKQAGYGVTPFNVETGDENTQINATRQYMTGLTKSFGGDLEKGLAAYNFGPGNLQRHIAANSAAGKGWKEGLPAETADYVSTISSKYKSGLEPLPNSDSVPPVNRAVIDPSRMTPSEIEGALVKPTDLELIVANNDQIYSKDPKEVAAAKEVLDRAGWRSPLDMDTQNKREALLQERVAQGGTTPAITPNAVIPRPSTNPRDTMSVVAPPESMAAGTMVPPRPTSTAFTGSYERTIWDGKYSKTHNPDGSSKNLNEVPMTPQQVESYVGAEIPPINPVISLDQAQAAQKSLDENYQLGPQASRDYGSIDSDKETIRTYQSQVEDNKDQVPAMDTNSPGYGIAKRGSESDPVSAARDDFTESNLSDTQKNTIEKLGDAGGQTDPAIIADTLAGVKIPPVDNGLLSDKDQLPATFWDRLSKSFGSLFTDKEFIKFGILLAGGMVSGGSFGGSLKAAGLYALQSADAREVAQASENKDLKKKLLDQGYSMEAINKYFDSGNNNDLGEPRTTLTSKATGEQMTIDRGPDSGKVYQVKEVTYATGKRKGDVEKVVMVDGKPIPLDVFQRSFQSKGLNVVPYSSSEHSPAAVSKRFDALIKTSGDIAEEVLDNSLGAAGGKGQGANMKRLGLPGGKAIANQAASYFKAIGFDPDNSDDSREINNLMESAVIEMIADRDNRGLKEVRSIEPYLANNIIKFRTGLNPDLLRINETTMVPPEKIVALHNLGKQVSFEINGGKISEPQVQSLLQQIAAKYNIDPELGKKYKASKDETKFYQYAKDYLSDKLKQAETK